MSIAKVRPSNLANIKRLANQLKKSEHIQHSQALDSAAQRAGFQNYEHARKAMGCTPCQIFLTGYWEDRETFEIGRETLGFPLSRPLLELVSKADLKLVAGLCRMRLVAPDHLLIDSLGHAREHTRDDLCKAARALRFMEQTGLRPCNARDTKRALAGLDEELPGRDHSSHWYEPASGQFIMIDEPYSASRASRERTEWARRNGWDLAAADWPGLYFPYRCAFFVASKQAANFDLGALVGTISAMPAPPTSEHWQGQSAPNHETFVSPLATSPQDKRRAKAKGTVVARSSRQTVPYHRDMLGSARKPNGRMTLEEHRNAGRMIRAVLQSNCKPWSVNRRMDEIMRLLVDWLYVDVTPRELNALPDPIDLYYGEMASNEPLFLRSNSRGGVETILLDLKALLERAYPPSGPLRKLTNRIETSLKITRSLAEPDHPNS